MSSVIPAFPTDLLQQSVAERMKYFDKSLIRHPVFRRVQADLLQAIRYPGGATLIFLHGPPSAGKTTLRRFIEQILANELGASTTSLAAVAGVEAVSHDTAFNWRDYLSRSLIVADALLPHEKKLTYTYRGIRRDSTGHLIIDKSVLGTDLRRAVEECFQALCLRAWLVDEAQHTKRRVSGRNLIDQMDAIKSLATLTRTLHVLIGNYELLDMSTVSGQLCWRSIDIEMPRYHINTDGQIAEFQEVLRSFQSYMPISRPPDLASRYEYYWQRSVGCIGVLKNWLIRSLAAALEDNQPTLTLKYLTRYELPAYKLRQLNQEISEGEKLRDVRKRGIVNNLPG